MVTLFAEIMFRNHNSSLLRQHTANQSFCAIHVYAGMALRQVLMNYAALPWVENGHP
jgi:hypothetical protein